MKNWLKHYQWHIISWLIFIIYEYLLVAQVLDINEPLLVYCIHYVINISLFYIHSDFTLNKSLAGHKPDYFKLMALIITEICAFTFISYLADQVIPRSNTPINLISMVIDWKFVFGALWRGIYFILFATAYYFVKRYIHQKQLTAALEKEAIKKELEEKQIAIELSDAKNSYLKAQINPHFLFNTLTYIYNSTHKSEPRAAEAVRYLSKLMRYALECEHGPNIMNLEAEILQVENLLQLTRIKQPDLYINFHYDNGIEQTKIIPLVLLTLTENMVKHGNLSMPDDPGKIDLNLNDGLFTIKTANLINTGLNDTGFHTGLNNIKQRLLHNYGNSAEITYGIKNEYFQVLIKIELHSAIANGADQPPLHSSVTD
ncbi:sensor histidine kinase [Pedobacter sp. N23S346]|uniref:sensor histidine kinase n=1 Tax=Pedobacter sp. N23S346 TaxID=3402750 RepID=UPI003AC24BCA